MRKISSKNFGMSYVPYVDEVFDLGCLWRHKAVRAGSHTRSEVSIGRLKPVLQHCSDTSEASLSSFECSLVCLVQIEMSYECEYIVECVVEDCMSNAL